mgnify:CR=1 FL=1
MGAKHPGSTAAGDVTAEAFTDASLRHIMHRRSGDGAPNLDLESKLFSLDTYGLGGANRGRESGTHTHVRESPRPGATSLSHSSRSNIIAYMSLNFARPQQNVVSCSACCRDRNPCPNGTYL